MAKAYTPELRLRVLAACDRGMATRRVAGVFGVSESWVRRIKQVRREEGRIKPRPRGGVTLVKVDPDRLRELVAEHPDTTPAEYHAMLKIDCGVSAVDQASRRYGFTYKKKVFAAEQDRPDVERGRQQWKQDFRGPGGRKRPPEMTGSSSDTTT